MDAALEVKAVVKAFGAVRAVDGLDLTVAADQQVCGHAPRYDLCEIRMHGRGQVAREELLYPRSAVVARRQADAVHDDEIRHRARRTGIAMRTQYLPHAGQEARGGMHLHLHQRLVAVR